MIILELELQNDKEHPLGLINWLMYFISQKYKDCQNIVLIDEIMNYNEKEGTTIADWSDLDTFRTNVDFLIALNPQGIKFNDNYVVVPPKNTNATLSQQLLTRHRNGYEIGIILEILKHNQPKGTQHSYNSYLDSSNDSELDPSKLPNSRLPIWIQRGVGVRDEEVLELIKSDYKFPHESVTLVYDDIDDPVLDEKTKEWCRINHWKYCTFLEMIGCEDQVIIILDCRPLFEIISRARNQLVIVTTQTFVYIN